MRAAVLALALALLAGCAMQRDIMQNDFVGLAPQSPPADIVGTWSGSMGPYLVTMRIKPDGRGVMCSSYNDTNSMARIKFFDGRIHAQSGAQVGIKSVADASMVLHTGYYMGRDDQFYRDKHLKSASIYCAENLAM